MKAVRIGMLTAVVALIGVSQTRSAEKNGPIPGSDNEKLIGAWHLVSITAPGPDGKPMSIVQPTGMLIYTRHGHMSVQLMYPKSANAGSNEYVQDGYEASFGSYDVNEATYTVTHHVLASIYARSPSGQGPTARVSVQRGPAVDHQIGAAGRALVRHMGALLTEPQMPMMSRNLAMALILTDRGSL